MKFGNNTESIKYGRNDDIKAIAQQLAIRNSKHDVRRIDLSGEVEKQIYVALKEMLSELNENELVTKIISPC